MNNPDQIMAQLVAARRAGADYATVFALELQYDAAMEEVRQRLAALLVALTGKENPS
ncbi:hypothetical protein Acor_83370 [Acrocarpospora corrugata]|uniref:Uncharacterized protein n=1 Tax=Acrocarpospora corrugata TaxID=35763 RepID=A0A5M3WIS7_9ACTN|nr:hypothetical protein [Acrocarpospora corrugata]GES06268.1 hypothetical protein Acor_83370 [Acrocarpospora corrugata]